MLYVSIVPAEVPLLGRWGFNDESAAALYGTLNLFKSCLIQEEVLNPGEFNASSETASHEMRYLELDPCCSTQAMGMSYVKDDYKAKAIEDAMTKVEGMETDEWFRIQALNRGGLCYSSRRGRLCALHHHINRGLVVVRTGLLFQPIGMDEQKLRYLNQIAKAFESAIESPNETKILGELLDSQHMVIAEHVPDQSQYCETYNNLKMLGALGCRSIGKTMFVIVEPQKREEFVAKVKTHLGGEVVLPIEFSFKGAEVRRVI